MYPRSFLNTRGVLIEEETPEAINMSSDSPESPEEAGAAAISPSPDTTYEAEEEADMLLNQAETGAVEGEKEKQDRSRVHSASTWTPPIKRGANPRGGAMRCRSPHLCRSAAFGSCRHEL